MTEYSQAPRNNSSQPREYKGNKQSREPRQANRSYKSRQSRQPRHPRFRLPHVHPLTITYPPQLPVSQRREEIAAAIATHQVVILSGETGSGKTTQLPKICLELGRGTKGLIGHTQPRRLAARTVAERIATELDEKLGETIGYQVRFTDEVGPDTRVKLMTDGILLAEIQNDPQLRRYDTIIVDEAHERSLNIDFILGYLARLLPQRRDLKVIITSATIDAQRFADHFANFTPTGDTPPCLAISGRTYPVEIRYRPLNEPWGEDPYADYNSGQITGEAAANSALEENAITDAEAATSGNSTADKLAATLENITVTNSAHARSTQPKHTKKHSKTGAKHGGKTGKHAGSRSKNTNRNDNHQETPDSDDQLSGICRAVDELLLEDAKRADAAFSPGDILVFLPGERDIRDTAEGLKEHLGRRYFDPKSGAAHPDAIEVLPLFARLSAAEQQRIFAPHVWRRVVLATNVAETSLTVPGIRYVIDPGLARISRYSNRTKVQRLPIEPVSQASANQRSGRCGRLADGIAIRLYSETDFAARPEFTEPEIQRTSLAAVILQMAALGLGEVAHFPFIDPPDPRQVRDGMAVLREVGALKTGKNGRPTLTKIGYDLARLPIDPRLGRMLLEGKRNGCASEMAVIVAALSMQDIRERPTEEQTQADQAHARFTDIRSDFVTYLNLWRYIRTQSRDLSNSAFRRMCRAEYLHYLRVREWQDVVSQLSQMAREIGIDITPLLLPTGRQIALEAERGGIANATARAVVALTASATTSDTDAITRSALVGLVSNIGNYSLQTHDYEGARGTHFVVWPGSGLAKRTYDWVVAAELVETSRLFARTVAKIEPEWVLEIAANLVKRSYYEPHWSYRNGAAMARERVSLYGLTLAADRPVLLARAELKDTDTRALAREMFIREALVEGNWNSHHRFVKENARAVETAREWERRRRQVGLVADPETCFAFFDKRLPADIYSAADFDRWWNQQRREYPHLLNYPDEVLYARARAQLRAGAPATGVEQVYSTATAPGGKTGHANAGDKPTNSANTVAERTEFMIDQDASAQPLPLGSYADHRDFPDQIGDFPVQYRFEPGHEDDGLTVQIPLAVLPDLNPAFGKWLVPGMFADLCTGLIKALPKRIRRNLVPAPDVGRQVAQWIEARGLTPWPARTEILDEVAATKVSATQAAGAPAATDSGNASATTTAKNATKSVPPGGEAQQRVAADTANALNASLARLAAWGSDSGVIVNAAKDTKGKRAKATGGGGKQSHAGCANHGGAAAPTSPTATSLTTAAQETDSSPSVSAPVSQPRVDATEVKVPTLIADPLERGNLQKAFIQAVAACRGQVIDQEAWQQAETNLQPHLRMRFQLVGARGVIATSRSLTRLKREYGKTARQQVAQSVKAAVVAALAQEQELEGTAQTQPVLPREVAGRGPNGVRMRTYPALFDPNAPVDRNWLEHPFKPGIIPLATSPTNSEVETQVFTNAAQAEREHRLAVTRLALKQWRLTPTRVSTRWAGREALILAGSPYPNTGALIEAAQWAGALRCVELACNGPVVKGGPAQIREDEQFTQLYSWGRDHFEDQVYQVIGVVVRALQAQAELADQLAALGNGTQLSAVARQVRALEATLMAPGFITTTPIFAYPHLPRYLQGLARRCERAGTDSGRDQRGAEVVARVEADVTQACVQAAAENVTLTRAARLEQARWLVEELRVQVFAQQLGTPVKVSEKRIRALLEQ